MFFRSTTAQPEQVSVQISVQKNRLTDLKHCSRTVMVIQAVENPRRYAQAADFVH